MEDGSSRLLRWWPVVFVPVIVALLGLAWMRMDAAESEVKAMSRDMSALDKKVEKADEASRIAAIKAEGRAGRTRKPARNDADAHKAKARVQRPEGAKAKGAKAAGKAKGGKAAKAEPTKAKKGKKGKKGKAKKGKAPAP